MDDGLGDRRIAAAARITSDIPSAYPGGPSHKAGAPFYLSCLVQAEDKSNIGFVLPSATAMALNISFRAAQAALDLKKAIKFKSVITPKGVGVSVDDDSNTALYDFFEQYMVAVTFAYQALEVFCNISISRQLKEGMEIKRRNKKLDFLSPSQIERELSTGEKISIVMPKITGIPSPKGKRPWEPFKKLENVRDSIIHLKSVDQNVIDKESLFFQFLNNNCDIFPVAALDMIKYFHAGNEPRWLKSFMS